MYEGERMRNRMKGVRERMDEGEMDGRNMCKKEREDDQNKRKEKKEIAKSKGREGGRVQERDDECEEGSDK